MKRILAVMMLLLCLTGCANPFDQTALPTTQAVAPETAEVTTAPTVQPTVPETTAAETQEAEQEEVSGFLQKINRIDQVIYEGPGYDYPQVGNLGKIGTYTITEEAGDESGNLWGRLKSGLGWVDLTQIWTEAENPPVITATYADLRLMEDREFETFVVDNGEFSVKVAICAHQNMENIRFYSMELAEEEKEDQLLFTLEGCGAGSFFVIDLAFPGDMTAYCIRFADESGQECRYVLTESGQGGLWLA